MNNTAILIQLEDAPVESPSPRYPGNDSGALQLIDASKLIEDEGEDAEQPVEAVEGAKPESTYKLDGDDPVQIYLRDMAGRPLLTREGEIKLARRIENGHTRALKSMSRSPVTIEELLRISASLKRGEMDIREVVCFEESEEPEAETADERLKSTLDRLSGIKKAYTRALKLDGRLKAEPKRSPRRAGIRAKLARARIEISRLVLALDLAPASQERIIGLIRGAVEQLRQARTLAANAESSLKRARRKEQVAALKRELRHAQRRVREIERRWHITGAELERTLKSINRGEAETMFGRNEMIEANLRLVISIARKYTGRGLAFADLVQEGNLGLMKAVERYDWRLGCKFSTYGTWWIRQSIMRAIMDYGRMIRIPVHMMETVSKQMQVTRALEQEMERMPTPEEIADRMQVPVSRVRTVLEIVAEPMSLDAPVGEDDARLCDFIEDSSFTCSLDALIESDLRDVTDEALRRLTPREEKVIKMRFGLGRDGREHTLEEVGEYFSVTRERVRQIEAKAIEKLRHPSRAGRLRAFAPDSRRPAQPYFRQSYEGQSSMAGRL